MANWTIPNLSGATVGYSSTIHLIKAADQPNDSGFTVTVGTRRKGGVDATNYNILDGITKAYQGGKRPQVGVLYPRGGG